MTVSNVIPLHPIAPGINAAESVTSRSQKASLEILRAEARVITALSKQADALTIEAAKRLVALKLRIQNGEAGPKVKWMGWLRVNVKLSSSRLAELIRIGESKDPQQALEHQRRLTRERAKKARDKRSPSAMSANRRSMLSVILKMDEEEVSSLAAVCRSRYPHLFEKPTPIH